VTLRVGASADLRYDLSISELIEKITSLGLNHLELRQGYLDVTDHLSTAEIRSVTDAHDVTTTVHAPYTDASLGNLNEPLRQAAVDGVRQSLVFANKIDAGGVVIHGGATRPAYPDRVNRHARQQALTSLRECITHAERLEIPVCLENQWDTANQRRHTATPDRLASFVADSGVNSPYLRYTLDVGHANVMGYDYHAFHNPADVQIVHLHTNDGESDSHDPFPEYRRVVDDINAPYNVLEMKSLGDLAQCVER